MGGSGGAGGQGGAGGSGCTTEVCDGLDNDCDGQTDEGCLCKDGDTQVCYSGDPGTANIGTCKTGLQTCDLTGNYGPCIGEVLPVDEACNGSDDDCDGTVDDDLGKQTCGLGACRVTVDACDMGMPSECSPLMPSPVEACDGTDDDCDGQVDEDCDCIDGQTQSCYPGPTGTEGVGKCAPGTQTCAGGAWGECVGAVLPADETCDNLDDDCDGETDEELGVTSCGTGACHATVNNCEKGVPQTCVPGMPQAETCNGIDDDCNLNVDDGPARRRAAWASATRRSKRA
jgi:hypothetical protein